MKKVLIYLLFVFINSGLLSAQNGGQILFQSPGTDGHPYRIPAITTLNNGDILALADFRWCNSDIGYGHIDLMGRISTDQGNSWGKEFAVAKGSGTSGAHDCGYGDAAVVTDRESGRVLVMCCTGNVVYSRSSRSNPMRCARLYSDDNGKTWSQPEDITGQMYALLPNAKALFLASGKICQSRVTKVGRYYRLYAALCTLNQNNLFSTHSENYVVYSDDFGMSWKVLGPNTVSCAPYGDEPKCEELPDGSVILSSRKDGGRYFNIFRFTDATNGQGSWQGVVASDEVSGGLAFNTNSTNGEIQLLQVVRQKDGSLHNMLIQSVPYGKINSGDEERSNVCIFYKVFDTTTLDSPSTLAQGWTRGLTFESPKGAYSTLCVQQDKRLGFLYETEPGEYSLVYRSISVEEITGNLFTLYDPEIHGDLSIEMKELQEAKAEAKAVLERYADKHAPQPEFGQYPSSVYLQLEHAYNEANTQNYRELAGFIARLEGACNWPVFTIDSKDPNSGIGKSLGDNGSGTVNIGTTNPGNTLQLWKVEGLTAGSMQVGDYRITNIGTGLDFWGADFVSIGKTAPNADGQFVIRTNGTDNPVYHDYGWNWGGWGYKDFLSKENEYGANSGAAWSFTFVGSSYEQDRAIYETEFQEALERAKPYRERLGETTGTYLDADNRFEKAWEKANSKAMADFETYELGLITEELKQSIGALSLNMPEPGKFYRFRSKNSGLYVTANPNPGQRLTMTDLNTDRSTAFFLSANGYLTDHGLQHLESSWTAKEAGAISHYTFAEALTPGYYTILPNDRSYLYDNSAQNGTLDNWSDAANEGCFWEIIEVSEPEEQPKLTRHMTAEYATVAAPVALQVPEGVTAYTVTVDNSGEELLLEELPEGIIPAGTGALIRSNDGETDVELAFAAGGFFYGSNDLQPVYRQKTIDQNVKAYILGNGSEGIGFYRLNESDRTLTDYKAYLVLPEGVSAVRALKLKDGNGTTGLTERPEHAETDAGEQVYYDLQGRRVLKPTRGIYLTREGRKIIFR